MPSTTSKVTGFRIAAARPRNDEEKFPPGNRGVPMQYIYTMINVSKIVPPKREIIKDISLSFFPGAKIGLLGLNGAGKSKIGRASCRERVEIWGVAVSVEERGRARGGE